MKRWGTKDACLVVTLTITFQQDEYSRLSRNASLGVHGYALVFSISSRKSFDIVQQINDSLLNTLGNAPDVPRVLVGSMLDLTSQRQVKKQVCINSFTIDILIMSCKRSFPKHSELSTRTPRSLLIHGGCHTLNAPAKRART